MAAFTVRVELHDATAEDYDKLHKAMKVQGFSRTIKDSEGAVYHLPTAEYRISTTTWNKAGVLELAMKAAAKTRKRHCILVTESKGTTSYGLEPV